MSSTTTTSGIKVAPTARNLLSQYGLETSSIAATGPKNVLLKEDVLQYIQVNKLSPKLATAGGQPSSQTRPVIVSSPSGRTTSRKAKGPKFVDLELTNIRKIIAKRLTESKTTIPHAYSTASCDVSAINRLRKDMQAEQGVKVSVNDFIIKAVSVSLKKHPQINVKWDASTQSITRGNSVDISIAVATPNGLITPIVKDANTLTVEEISGRVMELAGRAKDGKLQPHEFQGGSFSISNLGMFGIKEFSAVINPPQAAILAVGQGNPVVNHKCQVSTEMYVTLSYDARVIGEEDAASFMETLTDLLSNPVLLKREGDGSGNRRLSSLVSWEKGWFGMRGYVRIDIILSRCKYSLGCQASLLTSVVDVSWLPFW